MAKKEKVFGIARAGGKWHAGSCPSFQDTVARFRAHGEERSNVVMVRLSDDALTRINQLVDSTLVSSRSGRGGGTDRRGHREPCAEARPVGLNGGSVPQP